MGAWECFHDRINEGSDSAFLIGGGLNRARNECVAQGPQFAMDVR